MSWTYEIRVVVDIFFDTYVLNRGSLTVKNPLPLPGGIYSKEFIQKTERDQERDELPY